MNSTVWVTTQRNQGVLGTLNSGVAWGRGVQVRRKEGVFRGGARSGRRRSGGRTAVRGHGVHLAERDHSRRARVGARPWSWTSAGGSPVALAKAGVALVVLKENIRVGGKHDIPTKVMTTTLFALFAEVERDLTPSAPGRVSPGPEPRAGSSATRSARLASRASMAGRTRAGASSNAMSAPTCWRGFDERVDINCSGVMAPRPQGQPVVPPSTSVRTSRPGRSRPGAMAGACHGTASATTRGSAGPAAGRAAPRRRAAPRVGSGQRPSSSKLRR